MNASKGRWKKSAVLLLLCLALAAAAAGCSRTWYHNGGTDQQNPPDYHNGGTDQQGLSDSDTRPRPVRDHMTDSQEYEKAGDRETGGEHGLEKGGADNQGTSGETASGAYGGQSVGAEDHTDGMKAYRWDRPENRTVKLPSAYDYRKTGRAPQIGNQGSLGTC